MIANARRLAILLLLSFVVALAGFGIAYQRYTGLLPGQGFFPGIAPDGWISNGAEITLPLLANRGNRLRLEFNKWRPDVPPSDFSVTVCDTAPQRFSVSAGSVLEVSLRAACARKVVHFEVLNPFQISKADQRQLGAQLIGASVVSKLGIAVISPTALLAATIALWILALSVSWLLGSTAYSGIAYAVPLLALYPIARIDVRELANVAWLWVVLETLFLGIGAARSTFFGQARGSSASVSSRVGLLMAVCIAIFGLALRLYGITFGLPNNYHPDEIPKANAIMQMVSSHSLNPRYFLHPSLLLYCTYFVNTVFHWGWLDGDFRASIFLAGRTVSAVAGSASLFVLYLLGTRLANRHVGLLAAGLLAVFPLHVTCSRYLKEDSLLLFFLLCCVALVVRAVQDDKPNSILWAGLFAGLAASTKYSGILAVGIVAAAPWLKSQRWMPDRKYLVTSTVACLLAPIAFLAASPYIVLNYSKFQSDFRYERSHALRGHTQSIDAWSQYWMYHFWRSIIPGVTTLPALSAVFGCGLLLWRRRSQDLFLVALLLAFYLPAEWIKSKPAPQPERYIFPCLPFLALAAAQAAEKLRSTRFNPAYPLVVALLLLLPGTRSLELAAAIHPDTREEAAEWLKQNAAAGSRVLIDWQPYGPYLDSTALKVDYILRINVLKRLTPEALRASGADYLVLSSLFYDRYFSQPHANRAFQNRFISVFNRVPVIREFSAASGTYGFHNPTLTVFSLKPQDFEKLQRERAAKDAGEIAQTSNEDRSSFRWPLP